jgi:DNA-binding transcriptional ArsR family regulator
MTQSLLLDKNISTEGKIFSTRRRTLRLNDTELLVLQYLIRHFDEKLIELGFHPSKFATYSQEKALLEYTGKSQPQLSRALRHLRDLGLLECSMENENGKKMRGGVKLYWINVWKLKKIKELLMARGYYAALVAVTYGRNITGRITTWEIARALCVKKRTARKIAKQLVEMGVWKRWRKGRRILYEETRGRVPLDHWRERNGSSGEG